MVRRSDALTLYAPPFPWSQLGAKAGADYQGDGLTVSPTADGARLRCVFQRLEAEATREGLWLTSTVTNAVHDRFRIVATAVGREMVSLERGASERQSVEPSLHASRSHAPRSDAPASIFHNSYCVSPRVTRMNTSSKPISSSRNSINLAPPRTRMSATML